MRGRSGTAVEGTDIHASKQPCHLQHSFRLTLAFGPACEGRSLQNGVARLKQDGVG